MLLNCCEIFVGLKKQLEKYIPDNVSLLVRFTIIGVYAVSPVRVFTVKQYINGLLSK